MNKKFGFAVMLAVLISSGMVLAADGGALFGAKCAKCHGADGKGNPSLIKMMGEGLNLTAAKVVCADTVNKGPTSGKMKPVTLTPEEVTAVCDYAKTLK